MGISNMTGTASPKPSKRDLIVEAARKLFLEAGYGTTSMDALAAKAGVSKPTIYSYFANKEALFGAVMVGQPSPVRSYTLAASRDVQSTQTSF